VSPSGIVGRVVVHVVCLALGGVVGLAALMASRSTFPWGLLLAVGTSVAVPWRLLYSRLPRTVTSYALGWLVVFGVALVGRPEGDFLIAGDVEGYALIVGALLVLAFGVVALARSAGPARRDRSQ
jgi:hypothetical protein